MEHQALPVIVGGLLYKDSVPAMHQREARVKVGERTEHMLKGRSGSGLVRDVAESGQFRLWEQ